MVLVFSDKWTFRTIEHLFGFDVHLKLVRIKYVKKNLVRLSFDDMTLLRNGLETRPILEKYL